MRLHKSAGDEERLVLVFAEVFNRAVGGAIITVAFAVAVQDDDAVGIRGLFYVLRQRFLHVGGLVWSGGLGQMLRLATGGLARIRRLIRVHPRLRIVQTVAVINFAGADGNVAVFPEQLRQRCPVGMRDTKIRAVAQHAGHGWLAAGEQRGARGIAQRKLAVVAVETHAGFRQRVEVRRLRVKTAAVAAQFHAHVVRHDEQHVRLAGGLGNFRVQPAGQGGGGGCGGDRSQKIAARPAVGV